MLKVNIIYDFKVHFYNFYKLKILKLNHLSLTKKKSK